MKISILGAGNLGGTLGCCWARKGHNVFFGVPRSKDAKTQELLKTIGSNVRSGTVAEAAAAGDVIVLATPWPATRDAIQAAGNLADKVVVDCTNPLKPDSTGLAIGYTTSGAEQVAEWAKDAKIFKAFNQTGFNIMGNPAFEGQRAVMFVCGAEEIGKLVPGAKVVEAIPPMAQILGQRHAASMGSRSVPSTAAPRSP
jgi:predicted dinucleotide-binding enzyme